jgi:hypothetical protein
VADRSRLLAAKAWLNNQSYFINMAARKIPLLPLNVRQTAADRPQIKGGAWTF